MKRLLSLNNQAVPKSTADHGSAPPKNPSGDARDPPVASVRFFATSSLAWLMMVGQFVAVISFLNRLTLSRTMSGYRKLWTASSFVSTISCQCLKSGFDTASASFQMATSFRSTDACLLDECPIPGGLDVGPPDSRNDPRMSDRNCFDHSVRSLRIFASVLAAAARVLSETVSIPSLILANDSFCLASSCHVCDLEIRLADLLCI